LQISIFSFSGGVLLAVSRTTLSLQRVFFLEDGDRPSNDFIAKESNVIAHALASRANGTQTTMWQEEPPDFIAELLANDVTIFDNL
jgi:hypothetical protein